MNWQEEYKRRLCSAEEAVQHIHSGDTVFLGHAVAESSLLVDAMVQNATAYQDVRIIHMTNLGSGAYTQPGMESHFHVSPFFLGATVRAAVAEGRGDFIPCFFHEIPQLIRERRVPCDVLMTQVSPSDEKGYCSLGVSADYTYQALKSARTVIAHVNDQYPYTFGTKVHVTELDYIVEQSAPLYESKPPKIGEVEEKIGRCCASLIRDGATLQLGIGAIPDAVMMFLGDKHDLGIHSEMISDGTMELYQKGVITNQRKNLDRGTMTITFAMGTKKLYQFLDKNPDVLVKPVDYVNHPVTIMKEHDMISINSAIQVDLQGQVDAEAIGLRQFSGVGGQVDFIRGAAMGGGTSIIAMPSTTQKKDGTLISKIVPFLDQGAPVTTSRNDVDYIITEYGIAHLKGETLRDRAWALISISHPSVRDSLAEEFERRFHQNYRA